MAIFDYGGNLYDIDDLRVFANNGNGTFGTKFDLVAINMFRMEFQSKNQRANGDGGIAALASAWEAVNVTMRNVSVKRDVWALFGAGSNYEYGVTPNRVTDQFIEFGQPLGYFGVLARIFDGESATSGAVIFIPKIKIMGNVQWQAEYNTFVTPEITAFGIPDTNLVNPSGRYRAFHAKYYESNLPLLGGLTLPLPMGI